MSPPKELKNVAASVRQKLKNLAKREGAESGLVLLRYAGERFLYRLSVSSEVNRFTLKGAALFLVWARREFRVTKDIDFLGTGASNHVSIRTAMEAICRVPCPEDGMTFDTASIRLRDIREEQEYPGVRVRLEAVLDTARIPLQIDIGFGDVITPERVEEEYPALLDVPAPKLWTYPRETAIAEKFEAMVSLETRNTRMKDFWDVAVLAQYFAFEGEVLCSAVTETFRRRQTPILPEVPEALRPAFYDDVERVRLWDAFQEKVGKGIRAPTRFDDAGESIRAFIGPVRESILQGTRFTSEWTAGGPWGPRGSKA